MEMILNINGRDEILKDLEKAEGLIKEARDILYRIPIKMKIEITECDRAETTSNSRGIQ